MPGLIGIVGEPDLERLKSLLAEMVKDLKRLDWYQTDVYLDKYIGLGRVSLGIANPEPQPIWNEDKNMCIVMEGELFDYQDLKQHLLERGHLFQLDNDPEFALHLYEECGDEFIGQLNGAFALAIWDLCERRLFVATDRLGLYPLYYTQRNKGVAFASKASALLVDPGLSTFVDPIAVTQLLTFEYVLGNRTLVKDVKLIPPASVLTYYDNQINIRSYWRMNYLDTYTPRKEGEYLEDLIYYMRQAAKRQAKGGLTKGILLSGGLDSRVLLALMVDGSINDSLHSFTFGIPGCDDARFAEELAKRVGTKHHFFELKPDYLIDKAEEGVRLTDGLKSCVHMHALATVEEEAKFAQVVFKGFLGDALMGGHLDRQLWANYSKESFCQALFDKTCVLFSPSEYNRLFTDEFQTLIENASFDSFCTTLEASEAFLVADRQNLFDLRYRQRRFILYGVELVRSRAVVRTPFCDNDLVEFMLSVPPGLRYDRYLMKEAFIQAYPDLAKVPYTETGYPMVPCARDLLMRINSQARWRLRAAGLQWIPIRRIRPYAEYNLWMRTALRAWVEEILLSKRFSEREYFNHDYVQRLIGEHMNGADHAKKLGVLITLELWHQIYLD
jgi:asparagine synthase (glutamine-hydrolysing)